MSTVLTKEMAMSPYDTIKTIWLQHSKGLEFKSCVILRGRCETVREASKGNLLFIELCDGSTVKTLQCLCDKTPETEPLFKHCSRGATVELTGTIVASPSSGQPIEMKITGYKCLGRIEDPETYALGQQGYLSRDFLRQMPEKRCHVMLFLAIQIIKQRSYSAFHEIMAKLGIGEIQPTLITGNECEEGAHPFTVTALPLPQTDSTRHDFNVGVGSTAGEIRIGNSTRCELIDWTKDFFGQRVYLTVSSQLHLEATVLGAKRDGYCMTTAFRAEPSDTTSHLAEFLMPEWEIIGGGLERNMAIAQTTLQYIFQSVLIDCVDELNYIETYQKHEKIEEDPHYKMELGTLVKKLDDNKITKKQFTQERSKLQEKHRGELPSLIAKLRRYANEPYVVVSHKECIKRINDAIYSKELGEEMRLGYEDDLSRQHEYWICRVIGGGLPVFVTGFPKKIKAFYMPVIKENEIVMDKEGQQVEHVAGYDLLIPDVGEVVGGSQRIDDAEELVSRMKELGMNLKPLDWYIGLRRDASLPHGGAGLGFGRLIIAITGISNIRDMQEFPRAYKMPIRG